MTARRSAVGIGCLVLFALPFASVGAWMAGLVGAALWTRFEVRGWEETPAELHEVRLITGDGESGPVYRVEARYTYRFRGKLHEGDRVGLHDGADNIGSWQEDTYRELEAYRREGLVCPAYVDPRDPSRAVLVRDLRWRLLIFESVFAVVFGGAGFGVIAFALLGRRAGLDALRLRQAHPDQPWMWRPDWAAGRVRSSHRSNLLFPCAMAVFWNSFALLAVVLGLGKRSGDAWAPLVLLVMVAAGIGLAVWAARAVIRWRRFGRSVLELDAVPIPAGGHLAGTLVAAGDLPPGVAFELAASCFDKGGSEHGDKVLWQHRWQVPASWIAAGGDGLRIPVAADLPADVDKGLLGGLGMKLEWRLEARAELPGVDYRARFDLPVFGRVEQPLPPGPDAAEPSTDSAEEELRRAGVRVETLPEAGRRWVFPHRRHRGFALAVALALGVGIAMLAVLFAGELPAAVVWLGGAALLVVLVSLVEHFYRERRVEAGPHGLVLRGALLGGGRARRLDHDEIVEVKAIRGLQAGSRLYYRVVVMDRYGRRLVAASGLADQAQAKSVAAAIARELDSWATPGDPASG